MPKRVRPYGSADDAESAGLARSRPRADGEPESELARLMTVRELADHAAEAIGALNDLTSGSTDVLSPDEVRDVIASLERMGYGLPQLCEQLARLLVVQREDGHIAASAGLDPDFWVVEMVESLTAASQAADMMAAALDQASKTSAELRPSH